VIRFLLAILLWCCAAAASAHEVRPAFLKATELNAGEFQVVWKQPVISGRRLSIKPTFPEDCTQTEPRLERNGATVSERFTVTCGLQSGALSLPGLENTLTDAFVEIGYLDGTVRTALLKPSDPKLDFGGPQASPAKDYLWIGVEHIMPNPARRWPESLGRGDGLHPCPLSNPRRDGFGRRHPTFASRRNSHRRIDCVIGY